MSDFLNLSDDDVKVITSEEDLFVVKANSKLIEIPNNETNGDIFQKIYDVWDYKKGEYTIDVFMKNCIARFSLEWWNAPYKKGEQR